MVLRSRELYRSSNGDRWSLVRPSDHEPVVVRHQANAASGGTSHDIAVGEFLVRGGNGPEKQELVRLIARLVETPEGTLDASENEWMTSYDHADDGQR